MRCPLRIAIVGAGISGLVAARRLCAAHEVCVFESEDRIGGHTHTVEVEAPGAPVAVDTGFIVFNEPNYPLFSKLMGELGVASQPTEMSFSVRCDKSGLEYNGGSFAGLFARPANGASPRFLRMLADILRFGREAPAVLRRDTDETVAQFVRRRGFGPGFVEDYLVPLGASLWSCPTATFHAFPIKFVVEFLANHTMLQATGRPQWRVIRGGSKQYLEPLTRPFADRIRKRCPASAVKRFAGHVEVATAQGTERFDEAILACHADTALALLADPSPVERELLGAFPYQPNTAILHTDTSVLPRRKSAWASWNYRIGDLSGDVATVTYDMNLLQGFTGDTTYLVTLNDERGINPNAVLRRIPWHHPVYTVAGRRAQARHRELIRARRTSFCGAYWGFGFHEDGVRSASAVATAFVGGS